MGGGVWVVLASLRGTPPCACRFSAQGMGSGGVVPPIGCPRINPPATSQKSFRRRPMTRCWCGISLTRRCSAKYYSGYVFEDTAEELLRRRSPSHWVRARPNAPSRVDRTTRFGPPLVVRAKPTQRGHGQPVPRVRDEDVDSLTPALAPDLPSDPSKPWLPINWGSKSAWLESAHRAARVLRRDVAQASPQQIRQAIEVASHLNPGPWGGEFEKGRTTPGEEQRSLGKSTTKAPSCGCTVEPLRLVPSGVPDAAVHLARATRCKVMLPKYGLAPSHVYPTTHEDVYRALQGWRKRMVPLFLWATVPVAIWPCRRCTVGRKKRNVEVIRGLALLSPWCDLRPEAASIVKNEVAHSPFNHEDSLEYSGRYLNGHPADDPRVSPLLLPTLEGWPPVYLEWPWTNFWHPTWPCCVTGLRWHRKM